MTPKAQATKAKIDKWDCIKLKSFNQQKHKATYRVGKNICKPDILSDKGLISKKYKELIQLSTRKNKKKTDFFFTLFWGRGLISSMQFFFNF